jgi:glycosyltransferase involved in cell wall biosynthesis
MKISVVIPLYNKRGTVLRALNSIFAQTVQPEEVIVVNDGSTDGSEKAVAELNHPLVRLFHQANAGVSAARNRGIAEARSEWIAFLDADDEWLPEYLFTIKNLNKKYPQCSILATTYFLQNYKGLRNKIVLKGIPFSGNDGILINYFFVATYSHPPICSSAVVIKKTSLKNIGEFPIGVISGEDLITWAKLAVTYQIGYCLDPKSIFYQGESHEPISKPVRKYNQYDVVAEELIKIYNSSLKPLKNDIRNYISHWYKMRTSVCVRDYNLSGVWESGLKSFKYNPFNIKIYVFLFMSLLPKCIQKLILKIKSS